MTKKTIKIFIASSAELKDERDKCVQQIVEVGKSHKHLQLEPVLWEYDTVKGSQLGYETIQDAINPKLMGSDLAIFIFYSRIGQYTRKEFEYTSKVNRKLFVFFKEGFSPDKNSLRNYGELLDFKETLNDTVLYNDYKDLTDFGDQLYRNLNLYLFENYKPGAVLHRRSISNAKTEKATIAEKKKTDRIILSSQPLKQIELNWDFFKVHPSILGSISHAHDSMLEDYNTAFYNVPLRSDDSKLLNGFYKLYPFLNSISEIDDGIKNGQDSNQLNSVVALISLDNVQDAILPIGVLSESIINAEGEKKNTTSNSLYSGGIRFYEALDEFWGEAYGLTKVKRSKDVHDMPTLEMEGDKISIRWVLDPTTFYNSVDRQSQNVGLTANIPSQLKVIIFSHIERLPFSSNNFSMPEECFPWRPDNYNNNFSTDKFCSSSFSIVPNGLSDQIIKYNLQSLIKYQIQDFWGDDIPCETLMFIFNEIKG